MRLFYLSDVKYGGWPTFTGHLIRGLHAASIDTSIIRVSNKTESRFRPMGRGLGYRNLSLDTAVAMVEAEPERSLVVVAAPKQQERTAALLRAGASIVIHDPTEVKGEAAGLPKLARRVFTVRETNLPMLNGLLSGRHVAKYVPHPYQRCPVNAEPAHRQLACSISRVDYDKHTELIAAANIILAREGKRIAIWGAENRLFVHHKLEAQYPGWRSEYKGKFPIDSLWSGYQIARRYRTVVDMSIIKGDGGGTQYTHLEALDAGCALVLSTGWWQPTGEINNVATFCVDPERLAELVRDPQDVAPPDEIELLFARHEAERVARQYVEAMA